MDSVRIELIKKEIREMTETSISIRCAQINQSVDTAHECLEIANRKAPPEGALEMRMMLYDVWERNLDYQSYWYEAMRQIDMENVPTFTIMICGTILID